MQQVVWIGVVLLNVVWISFLLTPDLDFSVFVQRRSRSSSDESLMREFCLQPDLKPELDLMSTSSTNWKSTESSASRPDEDINIITEPTVIAEQDLKQSEKLGSADQNKMLTETDHEANRDLFGPTVSTDEQRPTSPPEFNSEADLVTKIPTTSENKKVDINQPDQQRINIKSRQAETKMKCDKRQEVPVFTRWKRAAEPMMGGPDECCYVFFRFPVDKNRISSYYMTDYRCSKRAVILIGKKGRHICVDPCQPWVENIMKYLDKNSF